MSDDQTAQTKRRVPRPSAPVLGGSISCFCIIPIAEIVIGAMYLHDCPRQPYIPIYLIVMGVFSILLSCLPSAREQEDGTRSPLNNACASWLSLISTFVFCWFIAGNVWIYSIYQPNYNRNTTDINTYCDKTVYLFAFWTTTLSYIPLCMLIACGVCFCCCFGCSFAFHSSSYSTSTSHTATITTTANPV